MRHSSSLKVAATAAAAFWAAVALHFAGPPTAEFVAVEVLPRAQATASTWLAPPYLYLLINAIILSIVASSRLQYFNHSKPESDITIPESAPVLEAVAEPPRPPPAPMVQVEEDYVGKEEEEDFVISRSTWVPPLKQLTTTEPSSRLTDLTNYTMEEKPLVSSRFGHRKTAKPSPEGNKAAALRVARSRRGETLESTWKAITEGRAVPLARHLKKSDTWDARIRRTSGDCLEEEEEKEEEEELAMRKCETFNEGIEKERRVRREASIGQDELNRKVEAFIKKFNEEMRLQRQESFTHYMEMINSGGGGGGATQGHNQLN